MISKIYKEALAVLRKKPVRLWGISLLSGVISMVFSVLFGLIIGLSIAFSMLISTGMTMVYLHGFRGEEVYAVQLFDCFKDWATIKRVVCGLAWRTLWLFLWALIPIAGPFIAIYKYYSWRLVPYILVQEPSVAVTEAINVSAERTMGYKGKMFGADILPFAIFVGVSVVLSLLAMIPFIGILFTLIGALVSIVVSLFFGLFYGLVAAGFYEEICGNGKGTASCPSCGAACESDSAFCSSCGAPLK